MRRGSSNSAVKWLRLGCELSGAGAGFEAELCADGVADHGERNPGADEEAVAAHEAAAVVDVEEGAPELFDGAAFSQRPLPVGRSSTQTQTTEKMSRPEIQT